MLLVLRVFACYAFLQCSNEVTPFPTAEKDSGATIESMHHHGKGVYSGTFSGKFIYSFFILMAFYA